MAKKKRSAALFEVMVKHEQRRLPRRPGMFQTIYLWFKNRPRRLPAMAEAVARAEARAEAEAEESAAMIEARRPVAVAVAVPVAGPEPEPDEPEEREVEYAAPVEREADGASETGLTVKRQGRTLLFRMSYGTAVIATFSLATVVVLAFLVGRKWSQRPQTVLAPTTSEKIRQQAPRANLTNVTRPPRPAAAEQNPEVIEASSATGGGTVAGPAPARSTERKLGFNYVMVQAYPEERMAIQAATLLQQNGIECTVEKGVPGFLKYSVVGMIGFTRISNNPQLDAYMSKIRSVGDVYTRNRNSFVFSFKPQPFKWQGTKKE
jgi:hypothetical protein